MQIICGWCGTTIGDKEPLEDRRVSHGMCGACEDGFNTEIDKAGAVAKVAKDLAQDRTIRMGTCSRCGYYKLCRAGRCAYCWRN